MCIHIAGSIGEKVDIDCNNVTITSMLVAQWLRQLAYMYEVIGSSPAIIQTFSLCMILIYISIQEFSRGNVTFFQGLKPHLFEPPDPTVQ